ncbi:hypothetical protein Q5752_001902 [Cryptotrichosporon argae]
MSTDLQWLLIRKWNSFQHKSGNGPVLSREKGNLVNLHSQKYSGLANAKVVSIHPSADASQIVIAKIKVGASPHQVASARSHTTLRRSTGPRRANKIAAAETAGKGYRPDLRQAAVARISALSRAQRRAANPPKSFAPKQRGKKAAKASAGTTEKADAAELD